MVSWDGPVTDARDRDLITTLASWVACERALLRGAVGPATVGAHFARELAFTQALGALVLTSGGEQMPTADQALQAGTRWMETHP